MKVRSIKTCSRCLGDHDELEVNEFTYPIDVGIYGVYEFWVMCPVVDEPIIVSKEAVVAP